jgi:hypothetical protein
MIIINHDLKGQANSDVALTRVAPAFANPWSPFSSKLNGNKAMQANHRVWQLWWTWHLSNVHT